MATYCFLAIMVAHRIMESHLIVESHAEYWVTLRVSLNSWLEGGGGARTLSAIETTVFQMDNDGLFGFPCLTGSVVYMYVRHPSFYTAVLGIINQRGALSCQEWFFIIPLQQQKLNIG